MKIYEHKLTGTRVQQDTNNQFYELEELGTTYKIPSRLIEHGEDWKELKYEILSFKSRNSGDIATRNSFGNFDSSNVENVSEKDFLNDSRTLINSIKRNSDEAVFTLGDSFKDGIITIIGNYNQKGQDCWICHNGKTVNENLETAPKSFRIPLFKTEDGVDIFEGEIYFALHPSILQKVVRSTAHNTINGCSYSNGTFKLFSSEDKAREYIELNKPCLSINDIFEMWKPKGCNRNGNVIFGTYDTKDLIDLVKTKLK